MLLAFFSLALLFPKHSQAVCGVSSPGICNNSNFLELCESACSSYALGPAGCTDFSGGWCTCDDGVCTSPEECPAVEPPNVCLGSGGSILDYIPPFYFCGGPSEECCTSADECVTPQGECSIYGTGSECFDTYTGPEGPGPCDADAWRTARCVEDPPDSGQSVCVCEDPISNGGTANVFCEGSTAIDTAIGCIPVEDYTQVGVTALRFALGIGGGIALLLIAYGGFMTSTSSGDPTRLQAGRELIFGAISGLLLITLSAFLLRIIGVNLFGIPGL